MRGNFEVCLTLLWDMAPPRVRTEYRLGLSKKTIASWRGCKIADVDLEELGRGAAAAMLQAWFWRGIRADELPKGIDFAAFDHAVYAGPKQAVLDLKHIVTPARGTVEMDGITLRALERADPQRVIAGIASFAQDKERSAKVADMAKSMLKRAEPRQATDVLNEFASPVDGCRCAKEIL